MKGVMKGDGDGMAASSEFTFDLKLVYKVLREWTFFDPGTLWANTAEQNGTRIFEDTTASSLLPCEQRDQVQV
ncbi:hypothetical protein V1478_003922 [Vespula squamosa]|uniref:Uncharacterized protein n=1 Tax=Vespula squamosa TaxID=30214 RepID=A0ABD2BN78_VESSQ